MHGSLLAAVIVVLIVLIVCVVAMRSMPWTDAGGERVHDDFAARRCGAPDPLYRTDDVDPLITGNLYSGLHPRTTYSARTALAPEHGGASGQWLAQFAGGGESLPGEVGVDVGPYGYGDDLPGTRFSHGSYDDGIPAQWAFPSTPMRWYEPAREDHYGPEGPVTHSADMYSLFVPDHDVLVA